MKETHYYASELKDAMEGGVHAFRGIMTIGRGADKNKKLMIVTIADDMQRMYIYPGDAKNPGTPEIAEGPYLAVLLDKEGKISVFGSSDADDKFRQSGRNSWDINAYRVEQDGKGVNIFDLKGDIDGLRNKKIIGEAAARGTKARPSTRPPYPQDPKHPRR